MKRLLATLFLAASAGVMPAGAVIILDSTWTEEGGSPEHPGAGFGAHIALANEAQFAAAMAFSFDGETWGECGGVWIGNDAEAGYVLTAGHCFSPEATGDNYYYRCGGGAVYEGAALFRNPEWGGDTSVRSGFDFTIVKLSAPATDCGQPASLYAGSGEEGQLLTFVGFGSRGIGSVGQSDDYYAPASVREQKAAGQGIVDEVVEAISPAPAAEEDAGNYFTIFFPKEDGSIANPYGGSAKPATRLAGLLGSGDSGSAAFMQLPNASWVVVGISSNGSGEAQYGDISIFARVSGAQDWILSVFPGARFEGE